jgi:hypothetical protein
MGNQAVILVDILGALVLLDPNTIQGQNCSGNAAHWVRYSSELIESVTRRPNQISDASWKNRLKVISWYE